MDNQIENPIIKRPVAPDYREWPYAYDPPCCATSLTFREWIIDTFTLEELLDYAEIKLATIKRLGPRYQQEMKDEDYGDIEEIS